VQREVREREQRRPEHDLRPRPGERGERHVMEWNGRDGMARAQPVPAAGGARGMDCNIMSCHVMEGNVREWNGPSTSCARGRGGGVGNGMQCNVM
jgi:hypothetical protein